jgi:hypothetical protein
LAPLLVIVQTLILVPCLALVGQFLVGAFDWHARCANPVYQMLGIVARPAVKAVRFVTPRLIPDLRIPAVAFAVLLAAYLLVGLAHRNVCLDDLKQTGCERWLAARGVGR